MPKLRRLSGEDVIKILGKFGFKVEKQRGSHVKLFRIGQGGGKEVLGVPMHDELDKGTLRAILRQATHYIPEDQLRSHFYTSG